MRGDFIFLIITVLNINQNVLTQFIFDKSSLCQFTTRSKTLNFINQTYKITSRRKKIYFSPCNAPLSIAECDPGASVCIIDKQGSEDTIKNAGSSFRYISEDKNSYVFKTVGGGSCSTDPNKNYSTIIHFDCNENKVNPRLTQDEEIDCEFEITMMKEDCQIPCTTVIKGNLIDLRSFKSKTITVHAQNSTKTLLISLCGAVRECGGEDVAGCDITDNYKPIASVQRQHLVYNEHEQSLIVRSRVKYGNKHTEVRTTDIVLKCNWHVEMSTPLYKAFGGKNYKIEIESKYGCIKPSIDCIVNGPFDEIYNFEGLHKSNQNWNVLKTTNGQMYLNICGPLSVINSPNDICSVTNSQVCVKNQDGILENWGSIFGNFEVISEGIVFLSIFYGSVCYNDTKQLMNTVIQFQCSFVEKGPVFKGVDKCTSTILWETPTACPSRIMKSLQNNCYLGDELGQRNVSGIYSEVDKILFISSSSSFLRYNLCGPLKQSCAGHLNVSVCLNQNNKEYVMGWLNSELISTNGMLSLDLHGEACAIGMDRQIHVDFQCNYSAPVSGYYSVKTIHNNCVYNMTVQTPLACLSQLTVNCQVSNESHIFDLTALMLKKNNYVVKDPYNRNIEYHIGICRPALSQDVLCLNNTSVCMKNMTEPVFKNKFKSFGILQEPIVEKGEVVIYNVRGNLCDVFAEDYTSVIRFVCSHNEDMPKVLKKNNCSVEFIWRTRHACPKLHPKTRTIRSCILKDPDGGPIFDFNKIHHNTVQISIKHDRFLVFDLCSDNYSDCLSGNCSSLSLQRKLIHKDNEKFLSLELHNGTCPATSKINAVHVKFLCGEFNNVNYTKENFENCILTLRLWTSVICNNQSNGQKKVDNSRNENETYKVNRLPDRIANVVYNHKQMSNIKNCTISNPKTGSSFSLKAIKPMTLSLSGVVYSVDFENVSLCSSFLCKEGVPLTTNDCPKAEFNYAAYNVRLWFTSNGNYKAEVIIKCSSSEIENSYITSLSNNSIIFTLNNKLGCSLFVDDKSSSTNFVIGSISGIFGIFVLSLFIYFIRGKFSICKRSNYRSVRSFKSNINLYTRNVQD